MERMIEEFLELVKINSNTKNERQMADRLTKKLKDLGCSVWEDDVGAKIGGNAGNLHAILEGSLPGSLLLTAHMDRVPGGENIVPVIGPEQITAEGDTILAADDLAGVCAILDCLRRLRESSTPHCTVEVLFTISEEVGLEGSRNLDYSKLRSRTAYVFDSSGRIGRCISGAPSKANIDIRVHGKKAHAGNEPEAGIDAAKIAGLLLASLRTGRLDEETVSNFPIFITNGKSTNIVCDFAQITGEARSRDHSKLEAYLTYLDEKAAEIAKETGSTIEVEHIIEVYAFNITADQPIIKDAVAAMEQLGIAPNVTPGGGCMDANWFNKNGICAVGLATGYLANHTTQECVYIKDLLMSGKLAEKLVRNYSGE